MEMVKVQLCETGSTLQSVDNVWAESYAATHFLLVHILDT